MFEYRCNKTPGFYISCTVLVRVLFLQNNGMDYVKQESPDIFTIQETKCSEMDLPMVGYKERKDCGPHH